MATNGVSDSSINGYSHDIDVEDLRVVAGVLTKHKLGKLPGPSLADELVQALMAENSRLRAEASSLKTKTVTPESAGAQPKMGFAMQVMTSELERSSRRLEIAQIAADDLEETSGALQEEATLMKDEFASLYEDRFGELPGPDFEEDFTPPTKEIAIKPMAALMAEEPHEMMTYKLWTMERKIEHAKDRSTYYNELPDKTRELRDALILARDGRWEELCPKRFAAEDVPKEVVQDVVSDLVVENAQLKKEATAQSERADSLQRQLDSSRDTVAEQKLTILEMRAQIEMLQRQLKGAERIITDQAVRSAWQ
ncbi:MAG: hypothetical protein KFB93_08965 [Simkaniaceae bacterium]|nr:MAG: hypothetical protein KFB93_08965 [Simkaniaceae bacterium]